MMVIACTRNRADTSIDFEFSSGVAGQGPGTLKTVVHTTTLILASLKSGSIRQRQIFFLPLLRRHGSTYRAGWGVSIRNEETNMHCSRRVRVSLSQFIVATSSQMISDIRIPILLCNCKDIRVLAKVRKSEVNAAPEMQGRPCLDMQPPGS